MLYLVANCLPLLTIHLYLCHYLYLHYTKVNYASRTEVSTDYLTQMFRARVIVTSNPSDWEGGTVTTLYFYVSILICYSI